MFENLTLDEYEDLFGWGKEGDCGEDTYSPGLLDYFNEIIEWQKPERFKRATITPERISYISEIVQFKAEPIPFPKELFFFNLKKETK